MRTLALILLCSVTLHAEATPFRWPAHEQIPARISDASVGINLGLDAWQSLYHTDATTKRNYLCRTLLTVGIAEVTKALIHRTRPDGSDQQSFFSEHTALATTAAHSPLTASMAVTVGWGRMSAGKHFGSDVGVGMGIGLLSRKVCQ